MGFYSEATFYISKGAVTVGTKRETCCLLNQFIFSKITLMKPIGVCYTDDIPGVLRAILIGMLLYCHFASIHPIGRTNDDFKSVPLSGSVQSCNGRCTSKIRVMDKNMEAKEMDRLIEVT